MIVMLWGVVILNAVNPKHSVIVCKGEHALIAWFWLNLKSYIKLPLRDIKKNIQLAQTGRDKQRVIVYFFFPGAWVQSYPLYGLISEAIILFLSMVWNIQSIELRDKIYSVSVSWLSLWEMSEICFVSLNRLHVLIMQKDGGVFCLLTSMQKSHFRIELLRTPWENLGFLKVKSSL